jgi:hypothetical protein
VIEAQKARSHELEILEVFQFGGGPVVITGRLSGCEKLHFPTKGELVLRGRTLGCVNILAERMPGPSLPRDQCMMEVEFPLGIDIDALRLSGASIKL